MYYNRKKIWRWIGVSAIVVLSVLVTLYTYIYTHKTAILRKVETQFSANYDGQLLIENIKPNLWKQFPNISFELQGVSVKDHDFQHHGRAFLKAKYVYIQLRILPLFFGNIKIGKVTFAHGKLCVYEGKDGVGNKSIFKKKLSKNGGRDNRVVHRFELEDFELVFINRIRNKDFQFYVAHLQGIRNKSHTKTSFQLKGSSLVRNLSFNTEKGSFVKGKYVDFDLAVSYFPEKNIVQIKKQNITIAGQLLGVSATFDLQQDNPIFNLNFNAKKLDYREAVSWMTPPIAAKLDSFILEKPIAIDVTIEGRMHHQRNPHVRLNSTVTNNEMKTRFGRFDSINFEASYNNGSKLDTLFGDENTAIRINKLFAKYQGIGFRADSANVFNLKSPELQAAIHSTFELQKLNQIFAKQTFRFGKGTVNINLQYKGQLLKNTAQIEDVDGDISVQNAEVTYLPRMIKFHNSNLNLKLHNQDIFLLKSELHTTKNRFVVSATAKDFFLHYKTDPSKVTFDASLSSSHLYLNEFQTFFTKRSPLEIRKSQAKKISMPDAIDKVFESSQTNLAIKINQLDYKKFAAQNIVAQLSFLKDKIVLKNAQIHFASGIIDCSGSLSDYIPNNTHFEANAQLRNVAIDKLLYGFGSFGQTTFLPENISGAISLKTQLKGDMDSNAIIKNNSLKGSVSFEVLNGELHQFGPLMRMGKLLFSKKRLDTVKFKKLSNHLMVNGNEISIPLMNIQTNLINMQLEGVYNMKIGSDLRMEIPLFDKDKAFLNPEATKGFRIYVRGKDDATGRMQFKWSLKNQDISDARAASKKQRKERKNGKVHE